MNDRPLVLYHGPACADGFCSAFCAWLKFGDDADYVPVNYGDPVPDVKNRDVLILDFSWPRPQMEQMLREAGMVTVLDHHRTAQQELTGLAVWAAKNTGTPCHVHFDMAHSGARLTWDFFFPGTGRPFLIDYVEDRDTWAWKLRDSREISAAIASYPFDFGLWDSWINATEAPTARIRLADEGRAILRYQQQQVDNQCKNAVEIELDGFKVLAVNATILISEIAGKLAESRPFGCSFFVNAKGQKVWSLRSRNGGVDVSEIAKRHGGGGHPGASGYIEG